MPVPWIANRLIFSLIALTASLSAQREESLLESRRWMERARQAPRSSYDRIVAYRRAIESDPHNPAARIELGEVFYEIAIVYGHEDLFEEAAGLFRSALEIDPELFKARYRLGTIYFLQRDFERSRRELEEARRINPDFESAADGLFILGLISPDD